MTMSLAVRRSLACVSGRNARKQFSTLVSLDYEFPGLPTLSPQPAKVSSASVTTLPSGLTIVTEDACTTSTVTLTYPKAGSSNEMLDEHGAAFLNKCLSFKSGSGVSTLLINRTIEDAGGRPFISVDRTGATLGYTVCPENAWRLVPFLIVDCAFEKWDVRDARKLATVEAEAASESAQIVLTENLYAAAYGPQSAGGRSFYECGTSLDAIKFFRARAYGLNGAVLAATGVKDHADFCKIGEFLSEAPAGFPDAPASMEYMGGESRLFAASPFAHVTVAFQGPKSSAVANVVKHALSLTGSASGVTGFTADGLVGVYAGSDIPGGIMDTLCNVVTSISSDTIKRAKSLAKAEALFALDAGSASLAKAMTAAVLEFGSFSGPGDVAKTYDAITEAHVKEAVTAMLKSNPSVAAVGNISTVPYHATIASRFS